MWVNFKDVLFWGKWLSGKGACFIVHIIFNSTCISGNFGHEKLILSGQKF